MDRRTSIAPIWVIWGLVALFGVIEAIAWTAAGRIPRSAGVLSQVATAWIVMIVLASLASRRIGIMAERIRAHENTHEATLTELEQLQTQNAMLEIIARSSDVTLAFQALASRIARLVPCDRVGLALLDINGQEFQTYTARVRDEERRARPRPEVMFKMDQTLLGNVVRSREPMIVSDVEKVASDFLDANVLHSAGFMSVLMCPLVAKGRAVGTLNVVSRAPDVYQPGHAVVLQGIAEILAVAVTAQQLQAALARQRSTEALSEVTLSIATEINSALQTIVGHCDLLERGYPDPGLQRDLAMVVRQAQRIQELLEKMRVTAAERLREVEAVPPAVIPSSPEAFGESIKPEPS